MKLSEYLEAKQKDLEPYEEGKLANLAMAGAITAGSMLGGAQATKAAETPKPMVDKPAVTQVEQEPVSQLSPQIKMILQKGAKSAAAMAKNNPSGAPVFKNEGFKRFLQLNMQNARTKGILQNIDQSVLQQEFDKQFDIALKGQ